MKRARAFGWQVSFAAVAVCLGLAASWAGEGATEAQERAKAQKAMNDGNWKDAYDAFRKLALDPNTNPATVPSDLNNGWTCVRSLGRISETDEFVEKAAAAHAGNWRLLFQAAQCYLQGERYGYIVAGKFNRGHHRGGGRVVNSMERDRVRALQLMEQALLKTKGEADKGSLYNFYRSFAEHILQGSRGYHEAWRLQYLSDLTQLPDYEEGWGYYYGGQTGGAPVNADGTPVFHKLPKSWAEAQSDGERWRWLQLQAIEVSNDGGSEVRYQFANFLREQFDVQTMAYYGRFFGGGDEDGGKDEGGPYAVHTLAEDETLAKLATGIKRFKLPDEFNFIKVFQQIVEARRGYESHALTMLGQVFEDRRQYDRSAEYWRKAGRQDRVDQILNNWGMFEGAATQAAGRGATVEYRYRNGKKASFEAYEVDVATLLSDVKAYLKSNPKNLDWNKVNIENVGHRIVSEGHERYVGAKVASWELDLKPRKNHFDSRITIATPMVKPGAYLVTAKMDGGNMSRIVLWVADTVVVKKPMVGKSLYYVADAVTGQPVAGAKVKLFGYYQQYHDREPRYTVVTKEASAASDADGQFTQDAGEDNRYSWVVTANAEGGRFAFLGFSHVWSGHWYDHEYNQTKVFAITDRPVYRPDQAVKFKAWVNQAKYDVEGKSAFAGREFRVEFHNPKGEKFLEKSFTADEYGGFDGEFRLAKDATLGVYRMNVAHMGGGTFRVEEYKKPEFEVKIEAPSEPVMLGEKVAAKIEAKYYFGAPVTEAKVKYKVLRSSYAANWYPTSVWDWMYQPGYWWFAYDYAWYPGWREWGCCRPHWWWWGETREQPEVVMEGETAIEKDGTLKIEIDSAIAKAIHPNQDHKYELSAEVTDQSRRTIVGAGTVMVARKPFKVYAWVDRGHYRVGDTIRADFNAQTLDNKPVKGKGALRLVKVAYDNLNKPMEAEVQKWDLDTDDQGKAATQIKASEAGQYRLSYKVTDAKGHAIEGGYVFCVAGEGFDGAQFRFNDLELVTDKREYQPGEKVRLMVNTNRTEGAVLLFLRPANGVYLPPKMLRLKGKSSIEEIEVSKKDMPNFFIEALTVSNGQVHSETREIVVPPEKRVLNVEVVPSSKEYKPGAKAKVQVKLTELNGEPYSGSAVVSIYDKAVEYISGGSNVPEIKSFFWKWRRQHHPQMQHSLARYGWQLLKRNEIAMGFLGVFGSQIAQGGENDDAEVGGGAADAVRAQDARRADAGPGGPRPAAPTMALAEGAAAPMKSKGEREEAKADKAAGEPAGQPPAQQMATPTVRTQFADTAFWAGCLNVPTNGTAEIELTMPENLTGWKVKVWAMGSGTRVGQGEVEVVTTKNLLVRLQAPRFFTQKDEVVLSANVHNYLKTKKSVQVALELSGPCLQPMGELTRTVEIEPKGEKRVDWRVKVVAAGEAVVCMKALTDEESDAMQMRFPAYVHGMLKTDSFAGNIRPDKGHAAVSFSVPKERRVADSRIEVRYSPTLAGAMVDALPYLAEYPYGCTEQTLNRFLPSAITQNILIRMKVNLKDIRNKITNLNAQEIGDDVERAKQWKRYNRSGVFDEAELHAMVADGVRRLANMQCSDGGWGWFSGWGEHSYPHTTAYVVHGMQVARENDVIVEQGVIDRGVAWLNRYQAEQVEMIKRAETKTNPYKTAADNLDAFVYMVLVDAKQDNEAMREYLYRDRNGLAVYAKAMFGLALHRRGRAEQLAMIVRNIDQFLVQDDENQTAYLKLPEDNWWWYWYGSEYEAQAYYLKLLAAADPKGEKAPRLVKYLINNRKHATYWNSTRDTAVCVEALADYIKATGEDQPDMTLELVLDGKTVKSVDINASNLFTYDNQLVLTGDKVSDGAHKLELKRKGKGPVYFNAYVTNFTMEDHITKAGLEIKVDRRFYKLVRVDKAIKAEGGRGEAVDQKVEKYERQPVANLATLKSGDLVEIELEIESKNDYEYIIFEDMKAAGFEPVDVRSGYVRSGLGAYMELRDERVCFFVRALARGKHSVSYRMRAEIPGKFSALPTKASAMYAPELRANSDEIKLGIED